MRRKETSEKREKYDTDRCSYTEIRRKIAIVGAQQYDRDGQTEYEAKASTEGQSSPIPRVTFTRAIGHPNYEHIIHDAIGALSSFFTVAL